MIQEIYQKAIKFAGIKHNQQKVPGTEANYLLHISNVAMEVLMAYKFEDDFDIELAIQLALLHDTLEDTDTNLEELEQLFGSRVAKGVEALSKNKDLATKQEKIIDSLRRINALEKEVGMVKLADRITNLQAPPKHWSSEKVYDYYLESKLIAEKLLDKNEYLHNRLLQKIEVYKQYVN